MPCPPARPAAKRRTINRPRITNHQSRITSHEQKTTPNPFSPNLPEINRLDTAPGTRPASRITKHESRNTTNACDPPSGRCGRGGHGEVTPTNSAQNNIESEDNMNQQTPRPPKVPLSSCGADAYVCRIDTNVDARARPAPRRATGRRTARALAYNAGSLRMDNGRA